MLSAECLFIVKIRHEAMQNGKDNRAGEGRAAEASPGNPEARCRRVKANPRYRVDRIASDYIDITDESTHIRSWRVYLVTIIIQKNRPRWSRGRCRIAPNAFAGQVARP